MADHATGPGSEQPLGDNLPILGVSELSALVKRTVEGRFDHVRVRGEISGYKKAASGHLYMALKDADAVLDAVCWRGVAGRLALKPEDGMEVIATGRLTTYPGRSKYQIVLESLELAGEGALLKLLEERRKKLAAEGLFEAERKRALPYLPAVIGVVTSPTGAVIRDIRHRLAERFPRRLLLWPVRVQGEGAAAQIAAAIDGFNRLAPGGAVPRPELIIVARGGGSLEDLWAFNEEIVVRAAAASEIPLISAVGHETDTTLIDYASDRRAPTPTAAAEMAVPVRAELLAQVLDYAGRLVAGAERGLEERRVRVEGLARGLPDPLRLLGEKTQRLDERAERLGVAGRRFLDAKNAAVTEAAARLPHPRQQLRLAEQQLGAQLERLALAGRHAVETPTRDWARLEAGRRLAQAMARQLADAGQRLESLGRVLESTSYQRVLARGFAVVRDADGLITSAKAVTAGRALDIEFSDGHAAALGDGAAKSGEPKARAAAKKPTARRRGSDDPQGQLL